MGTIGGYNQKTTFNPNDKYLVEDDGTGETEYSYFSDIHSNRPFSGALIYISAADISIAHNTVTAVLFDGEEFDTDNYHNSTNKSRFTAPIDGWYELKFNLVYESNNNGFRYGWMMKNGDADDRYALDVKPGDSSVRGSRLFYLTAGDYVELNALQTSTVTLKLQKDATNPGPNYFQIEYKGK